MASYKSPVLVLDNGAGSIKVGWSDQKTPQVYDNCKTKSKSSKKFFVGPGSEKCTNKAGLLYDRPFQKGYLIDVELQREIWAAAFKPDYMNVTPSESGLIVTEPVFDFNPIKESLHELAFEEFGFESMFRAPAADMCAYSACRSGSPGCLVVDAGFSFAHTIPYLNGKRMNHGIRRLDIGGKAMTNHLKELISYRQLDVSDETYVVDEMKKHVSYVVPDYMQALADAKPARNKISTASEYVLPDFCDVHTGFLRETPASPVSKKAKTNEDKQQTLKLTNERFAVPELLFRPMDAGLNQMGLSSLLFETVKTFTPSVQPLLYANIVTVGGNATIPGFRDRLFNDLRQMAPIDIESLKITAPSNPDLYPWESTCTFAKDKYRSKAVTKAEYEESGHKICYSRFDNMD
eukprot:m.145407 g.145407  ORF g.145407 m.145407 type:complete len:405 (-) comp30438_c2_seq3:43-1257(-)